MGLTEIIAFFRALPALVQVMGQVVSGLKDLRQDAVDKSLDSIRNDVSIALKQISEAKTNEDRINLIRALNLALSK